MRGRRSRHTSRCVVAALLLACSAGCAGRQRLHHPDFTSLCHRLLIEAQLEEATRACLTAITLVPCDADALVGLSLIARRRGDVPGGRAMARRAVGCQPEHLWARAQLADLLLEEADLQAALAVIEPALELPHENVSLLFVSGKAFARAGRLDEARRVLRRLTAVAPSIADAWYELGFLLPAQEARQAFLTASALDASWTEPHVAALRARPPDASHRSCFPPR